MTINSILSVIICFIIPFQILSLLISVRSIMFSYFRSDIANMCFLYDIKNSHSIIINGKDSAFDFIYQKLPSSREMIYSFKSLKLENWIDEKDILELKNGIKNPPQKNV